MKKFEEYIKESYNGLGTLNDWDDESLRDRLDSTRNALNELKEEIDYINNILVRRKEKKDLSYGDKLPESIFDFNKEQLEFIFEAGNHITSGRYKLSHRYYEQLIGVYAQGYNPDTSETFFQIRGANFDGLMDEDQDNYIEDYECVKSIKFLGDNLKRKEDHVVFSYSPRFSDEYNLTILYFSANNLQKKRSTYLVEKEFNSIDNMLKYLVEDDIENRKLEEGGY